MVRDGSFEVIFPYQPEILGAIEMYRIAQQLHFAARYQRFAERAALDRAGHHASAAERNYLLGRSACLFGAKLRIADERYPVCLSAVNLRLGVDFNGTIPEASGPLRREIFNKKLVRVIIRAAQSVRKQLQQLQTLYQSGEALAGQVGMDAQTLVSYLESLNPSSAEYQYINSIMQANGLKGRKLSNRQTTRSNICLLIVPYGIETTDLAG